MIVRVWILSLILSSSWAADKGKIEFNSQGGKLWKSTTPAELAAQFPTRKVQVWQPEENRKVTYQGYSTRAVLDKIYGSAWHKAELILFICADGYHAPVPRINLEGDESTLATSKVGEVFTLDNKAENKTHIPLAPLYLVWNNLNSAELKAEGPTYWPYQIVGVELAQFSEKYPHMIPASGSSPSVHRGFLAFQHYCLACHKMKGDGGDLGPELKDAAGIPDASDFLAKWIDNPSAVRPGTKMPPLVESLPHRKDVIADLIAYLMKMHDSTSALLNGAPVPRNEKASIHSGPFLRGHASSGGDNAALAGVKTPF